MGVEWTWNQCNWYPYWKGKFGHRHGHRNNVMWRWRQTSDDAPTSRGIPMIARKPREARKEGWNRLLLTVLRRSQPCHHLDLTLLASRTVRKWGCCLSRPVCGIAMAARSHDKCMCHLRHCPRCWPVWHYFALLFYIPTADMKFQLFSIIAKTWEG